jgi:hypothetical protein
LLHGAAEAGFHLKSVAMHKQVLALDPARRDVRRRLAEGYIALGLLDDGRAELACVATEARIAGDEPGNKEALSRSASSL